MPALVVTVVIAFIVCGIGLVVFLNLTVAVGTLNAIIFYANMVAAYKSAFSPHLNPTLHMYLYHG